MVQAHFSGDGAPPVGKGGRSLVTTAASSPINAELLGALFDVLSEVRQVVVDPSAGMPVLLRLASDGAMRSCDVAQRLRLDQSTVSRHMAALEADGLVHRLPHEGDRRAHLLDVTPAGHLAATAEIARRAAHLEDAVAQWSEADVHEFARLLEAFADGLSSQQRHQPHTGETPHE